MQPAHGANAQRSDAVVDFLDLFGGVDVNRTVASQGDDLGQFARADGAKAMRRDADRPFPDHAATILDKTRERREIVDEPPLFWLGRRASESRMGVEHRKQRHADTGAARRGQNSCSHFRWLRVGRAIGRMMKVMELGDGSEPRLQHLDIELRGDCLHVIRRHHQREPIHRLTPGPERVGLVASDFSEARHGALEGVAVEIRHGRRHDRVALVPFLRRRFRFHSRNRTAVDRHPDVGLPTIGG